MTRLGWPSYHFFEDSEGSVADGIDEVFRLMSHLGVDCVDVEVPRDKNCERDDHAHHRRDGRVAPRKDNLRKSQRFWGADIGTFFVGFLVPARDYYNALANRASVAKRALAETFECVDAVITPVWPYPLPIIEESDVGVNSEAAAMVLRFVAITPGQ